jgi:hypothetical protein
MEVTSEIQNQICGFAFPVSGSESGAINPKIVCNETGKNVAGSCVVCIECYQSQDYVQRDRQKCCRIVCGLHRMLSIPRLCATRPAKMSPDRVWAASNAINPKIVNLT